VPSLSLQTLGPGNAISKGVCPLRWGSRLALQTPEGEGNIKLEGRQNAS
jgi:hypothetical protein